MRLHSIYFGGSLVLSLSGFLFLAGCAHKETTSQADPYEKFNRKVYQFNTVLDKVFLKTPAKIYKTFLPAPIRKGVSNFYNNLDLIPSLANDLFQAEGKWVIKDSWRFLINSTLGIGGLFDVAQNFGLPPHSNDLGLTLAKWGDKNSPYLVLPLLGPSTIRDGAGWLFQTTLFTPYLYIHDDTVIYSLFAVDYVDTRAELLDTDQLMEEVLDKYSFVRDAYLQHRNYLIGKGHADNRTPSVSANHNITSQEGSDYVDE